MGSFSTDQSNLRVLQKRYDRAICMVVWRIIRSIIRARGNTEPSGKDDMVLTGCGGILGVFSMSRPSGTHDRDTPLVQLQLCGQWSLKRTLWRQRSCYGGLWGMLFSHASAILRRLATEFLLPLRLNAEDKEILGSGQDHITDGGLKQADLFARLPNIPSVTSSIPSSRCRRQWLMIATETCARPSSV